MADRSRGPSSGVDDRQSPAIDGRPAAAPIDRIDADGPGVEPSGTADLADRGSDLQARTVAHDVRTPLDAGSQRVARLQSLVAGADLPEKTRAEIEAQLDGIERAIERAAGVSERLLSAPPAGGDDPEGPPDGAERADPAGQPDADDRRPVTLRRVAADAWEVVDSGGLELAIRGSLPIDADEGDLRRLLENCYRNAVEHAEGATTVEVGVAGTGFHVADDGAGASDAAARRAFERGYSTTDGGTGLGLWIVREVAREYGWRVELDEGEAGGFRVAVDLDPAERPH